MNHFSHDHAGVLVFFHRAASAMPVNSLVNEAMIIIRKRIVRRLFFSIIFVFSVTGVVSADVYKFNLINPPDKEAELPKVEAIGDLVINGTIHIPAYQLTVLDSIEDSGWSTVAPETLKVQGHLDPKFAGRLTAYFHTNGWMLVPQSWKVTRGAQGVDGSAVVSFAPPTGQGHLTYSTAGACVGCAQSNASIFFPEARRSAKENDFLFYNGTNVPIKTVRIRPKIMAYHVVVHGQPIDGLAFYDEENDFEFSQVEVSLPTADRDLATPILNWFLPSK